MPNKKSFEGFLLATVIVVLTISGSVFFVAHSFPALVSNRIKVDESFHLVLAVVGPIFVAVQLLLAYLVWRYPAAKQGSPRHVAYLPRLTRAVSITLLVAEGFLIVQYLLTWTAIASAPPARAVTIEVTGRQFQWVFRYPGPDGVFGRTKPQLITSENLIGLDLSDPAAKDDIVTPETLYLPLNQPVRLILKSTDMIHSFFLPDFRVKQDTVPGLSIQTWFVPTKAGTYPIVCAQFCGADHFLMKASAVVLPLKDYQDEMKELEKGNHS